MSASESDRRVKARVLLAGAALLNIQRKNIALLAGTTESTLARLANGERVASEDLVRRIEEAVSEEALSQGKHQASFRGNAETMATEMLRYEETLAASNVSLSVADIDELVGTVYEAFSEGLAQGDRFSEVRTGCCGDEDETGCSSDDE